MTDSHLRADKPVRRLLVADILGQAGKELLAARNDIDVVEFPNTISQHEFRNLLATQPAVHGVILGLTYFGAPELAAAKELRVVARIGVGYDAIDVPVLSAAGVPVMICAGANSDTVAEHTLSCMLALVKRMHELDALVRMDRWHQRYRYLPGELRGCAVLIVGFGRIGARVARLCQAFGMRVAAYDPYLDDQVMRVAHVEPVVDLDEALRCADFVTLHCPKTSETVGMFDRARLARVRQDAFLINTARGGIVDHDALADRLASGHIAGAAIDVFPAEPPDPGNRLLEMSNVICSPHLAGVTREAVDRMALLAAGNVLSILDRRPQLDNIVNRSQLASLSAV